MFAPGSRSAIAALLLAACALNARADTPMHQKKPVRLLSTVHATYRLVQQDSEVGTERVERRTYDDNTVTYDVTSVIRMGPATISSKAHLVLDDDSYFPRSYRNEQVIEHGADTTSITYTAEVYSNVVVVGSDMQGRTDARRIVVPAGLPIMDLGNVFGWYQIVFWTDLSTTDRQRIQWLDVQRGRIESGEIYVAGEQTIDILGKKTPVSVLKAERERVGPAQLYVDSQKRIVRCEQNVTLFELVEWTEDK
jgi:hypothetical protein